MDYIIRGKLEKNCNISDVLSKVDDYLIEDLDKCNVKYSTIIDALDKLGAMLINDKHLLMPELLEYGLSEEQAKLTKEEAYSILNKEALNRKVSRELGNKFCITKRISPNENVFERWQPLGVLGHVTSSNDALLPFFSSVEGLITGNINIIKPASNTEKIVMKLVEIICEIEHKLSPYYYVLPLSSKEKESLKMVFSFCDGIAVWGSDKAIDGVKSMVSSNTKIIEWGHRISIAYFTKDGVTKKALENLCIDICINDQQACSSPQVVYFDTNDRQELISYAEKLYNALEIVSPKYIIGEIQNLSTAEITSVTLLEKMSEIMGDKKVFISPDNDFRIFVDFDNNLTASPLYRTVIVKPLVREDIVKTLRPYRSYMQSVALACDLKEIVTLTDKLLKAGITRIKNPGSMLDDYIGEPHDGVYALSQYVKRVSIESNVLPKAMMSFSEIISQDSKPFCDGTPILKKKDFHHPDYQGQPGYILLKSGGSSGKSIYAPHKYEDAETTYITGGNAMLAAGLDPKSDICINLFYSGHLYGGFISIYESLKYLGVTQLPMTAIDDFDSVVNEIINNNVNVLVGMPTYLMRLFDEQSERLINYNNINKIFYAGEHFYPQQVKLLKEKYGIKIIKSLVYGCNELGTIGYSCEYCTNNEHHLNSDSKYLEIIKMDCDEPAENGEVGRVIISSTDDSLNIYRYEIGDLARLITEPCKCGRLTPKFELLGRYGDILRFATSYINTKKIKDILYKELGYNGELQIILDCIDGIPEMTICVNDSLDRTNIIHILRENYYEIDDVIKSKMGNIFVKNCTKEDFILSEYGGKIRLVVDRRNTNEK
ncbi:hypothetical protein SH1V18_39220 [Vallitalea longa]|uniref:long-chain-fatty-acyl-CoA reductase n=1 Tax=Vallitalea longa TaxID=2936439 RepID=A0A9W6DHD2_9FIRM|nr:aldehyde dehydrogenase family protein [Vallitalea longa]GKX31442.1 hypothetical protein SH1V18_39220 [Vallitalea longa]